MNAASRPAALVLAAALALFAGGSAARADDKPVSASGSVSIEISSGTSVADFLTMASKATGRPILWSADDKAISFKKFSGAVAPLVVPSAKFFETVRALLVPMEVLLVPTGPAGSEIWYATDARALQSQFVLRMKPVNVDLNEENLGEYERQDGLFVSTVIRVKNLDDLRDARSALQRLVTQNNVGSVQEVPSAKAFIVTDFAPTVVAIYRTLRYLDVPRPRDPGVAREFFRLKVAKAGAVRAILVEQFSTRTLANPVTVPGQAAVSVPDTEPRFSADDATNQVVVSCREPDLAAIRRVIENLDQEPVAK